jgi:hypothetical protein
MQVTPDEVPAFCRDTLFRHLQDALGDRDQLQRDLATTEHALKEALDTLSDIAGQLQCRCGDEWTQYDRHDPCCRWDVAEQAKKAAGT